RCQARDFRAWRAGRRRRFPWRQGRARSCRRASRNKRGQARLSDFLACRGIAQKVEPGPFYSQDRIHHWIISPVASNAKFSPAITLAAREALHTPPVLPTHIEQRSRDLS